MGTWLWSKTKAASEGRLSLERRHHLGSRCLVFLLFLSVSLVIIVFYRLLNDKNKFIQQRDDVRDAISGQAELMSSHSALTRRKRVLLD